MSTLPPVGNSSKVYESPRVSLFITGTPGGTWSWTNMGMENSPLEEHCGNVRQVGADRLHVLRILAVVDSQE